MEKKNVPYEIINAKDYAFKYNDGQVFRKLNYLSIYVKGYGRQNVLFDITEIKGDELIFGQP